MAWLAADLWTKHWADTSLANPRHPLPVRITAEDAGRSLADVMAGRFAVDREAVEGIVRHTVRLPDHQALDAQGAMFAPDGPQARAAGFYVFWRADPALAPRRIDRRDRTLLTKWLGLAAHDRDPEKVRAAIDAYLADQAIGPWLQARLRRLSDSDAARVAAEGMHPIYGAPSGLSPDHPVAPGDAYLVRWRRVDVMGDWFKFVYAENTGAAFGFLKGLDPTLRDVLFFVLTIVVFLVILRIVVHTEPGHWVVQVALTGVLAGAAGNFVDRIRYGYVIDFIDMDLGFMHWPTYNVADMAISCGVVLLMIDITFNKDSPLVAREEEA